MQPVEKSLSPAAIVLRAAIVGATLVTAYIHSTLGGPLFTLNAAGYLAFAVAMVVPSPAIPVRWLVRAASWATRRRRSSAGRSRPLHGTPTSPRPTRSS